jgi:hypothetical protein
MDICMQFAERLILALLLTAVPATTVAGQTAADTAAILATSRAYIDAIWESDSVRMRQALHPDLAKRAIGQGGSGTSTLTTLTAEQMVAIAGEKPDEPPPPNRRSDIRILHSFGDMASVVIDAGMWVDYVHLAKWNGEYKIFNILFDFRRK